MRRPPEQLLTEPYTSLVGDDIHVWDFVLSEQRPRYKALRALLDPAELTRAARLAIDRKHPEYVICRGVLRSLLGYYTGCDPCALRFDRNPYGKPFLDAAHNAGDTRFNLSHSGDRALIAVTRGYEVGVDLEQIRENIDYLGIAQRFFAPSEVEALAALPADLQRPAFFLAWTRKEALLKGIGEGFFSHINAVEVPLDPRVPTRVLAINHDAWRPSRWSLYHRRLVPDYVVAVALGHEHMKVHWFCWEANR